MAAEQRATLVGNISFVEVKTDDRFSTRASMTVFVGDAQKVVFVTSYSSEVVARCLEGTISKGVRIKVIGKYSEFQNNVNGVDTTGRFVQADSLVTVDQNTKMMFNVRSTVDIHAEEEREWMSKHEEELWHNTYLKCYAAGYFHLYRDFKEEFWLQQGFPALSWEYDPERDLKEQALEAMERCYGRILSKEEMEAIRERYHREWAELDKSKDILNEELEKSGITEEKKMKFLQNYENGMVFNSIGQLNVNTIKRESNEQEAV